MKTQTVRTGYAILVGLSLMTAIPMIVARGQAPVGTGGFGGPGNGGPGGPPPGGFGGPGNGGPGGFPGQSPFAFGTVSAVDANAGTITLTSQYNGGSHSQVIKIGSNAQLVTQSQVAVADLKIGDQVQVQGVPTGITVSQFTVGQPPAGLPGAGGFGGPRGGGNAAVNAGGAATPPSFAAASGTITALPTKADPHLAISLNADTQIFLKIADGAKLSRYTTLKIADVKSGDRITATGQTASDGTLAVSMVGVNLAARNGFGGPGGPGQ